MLSYPTPHIKATSEEISKTVLMPGDPKRAELVAKKFLKDAFLFNNVRGVCGYTGTWKGIPVSVMASGMGMPSMGIYSYELYNVFGVENIIRIGSAGAICEDINVRDIVVGMGACTDSAYGNQFNLGGTFAPICSYDLLKKVMDIGAEKKLDIHVGNLLSSDHFYCDDAEGNLRWKKMGVLAVEMEAAALYMNAARAGKKAIAVCTVSDNLATGQALSSEERESGFSEMIELALDTAASL